MHDYGIGAICSVICSIQADFFEKRSVWREARVALGSDMPGCCEAGCYGRVHAATVWTAV